MHSIPVAHLALRPSVVLLERWPQQTWVKMREAGLVKVLGYLGNHVLLRGVPPYRAPELWAGKDAGSGISADLYSLGVILYEMLAGRPPFRGDSISLMYQHLHEPPPPLPPAIPAALRDLVMRMLDKDPAQRPPDARGVGNSLAVLVSMDGLEPRAASVEATAETITLPRAPVAGSG